MSNQIESVKIDITVLLGRAKLPMQQLLRMGRGAVIPLDATQDDEVWVIANDHPIARGEIALEGEKITINITGEANIEDYYAFGS